MDMEFGPDGALYTLEYGDGFFAELPEAQLSRIDFVRGGEYTPVVQVSATPTSATAPPLTVRFSSAGTKDPDGDNIAYAWDFDANGTVDSRCANPTHTYTQRGIFEATLRVTDTTGRSALELGADRHRQPGPGGQPRPRSRPRRRSTSATRCTSRSP